MSDVSEIVKSGALDKIADIFHKLAGPMAEEFGLLLADKAKVYRLKNWVGIIAKTEVILKDAKLSPKSVPPRLLLPIIESSSLEDDETLQSLWAGLLATASQETDSASPSFIETLKQLTPNEARHLKHLYETLQGSRNRELSANLPVTPYAFTKGWGAPSGVPSDTFERLGLIRRDFNVTLRSRGFGRRPPSTVQDAIDYVQPEMRYQFVLTEYLISFLKACNGPRAPLSQAVQDAISEIRFAKSLEELQSIWTSAYQAAEDDATRAAYIAAKEARQGELAKPFSAR